LIFLEITEITNLSQPQTTICLYSPQLYLSGGTEKNKIMPYFNNYKLFDSGEITLL
jgi:hypothetical protein